MEAKQQNMLLMAKSELKENQAYLAELKFKKIEGFVDDLKEIHHDVFQSTNCLTCANCCLTTPALITRQDIKRIALHLGLPPKTFIRKYVLEDINGEMVLNGVPCKFLDSDYSCTIYDIRPESCKRFPHTDEKEYTQRTKLNLANTLVCPASYQILKKVIEKFPIS